MPIRRSALAPEKPKPKIPELVKDIIRISDIVLEVLDARFIQETRNKELEEFVRNLGKKIIFVLNKKDLVDMKQKAQEIIGMDLKPYFFISARKRLGIAKLRRMIKIEAKRLKSERKRVNIGIIGYPNTGKSSLINILTGKSSAKTGADAGFTKGLQYIRLTAGIRILDTPGVLPESEYSSSDPEAIKKQSKLGGRTINTIRDPEMVVTGLMESHAKEIEKYYGIHAGGDAEVLIENLGRKKRFLKKGGLVDEDRAAKFIIRDWQKGRIRI